MSTSSERSSRRPRTLAAASVSAAPHDTSRRPQGGDAPASPDWSGSSTLIDDRIPADPSWRILGFRSEAAFNHARRAMQLVRDRVTGRDRPYPDFGAELGLVRDMAERRKLAAGFEENERGRGAAFLEQQSRLAKEVRAKEVAFDESHVLVVPEWGGVKWPKSAWTYSRRVLESIRVGAAMPTSRP